MLRSALIFQIQNVICKITPVSHCCVDAEARGKRDRAPVVAKRERNTQLITQRDEMLHHKQAKKNAGLKLQPTHHCGTDWYHCGNVAVINKICGRGEEGEVFDCNAMYVTRLSYENCCQLSRDRSYNVHLFDNKSEIVGSQCNWVMLLRLDCWLMKIPTQSKRHCGKFVTNAIGAHWKFWTKKYLLVMSFWNMVSSVIRNHL